jgi:hypothetical protein
VELDLQGCSLEFGVAPCSATGTGDAKCFRSFATCLDKPNFTPTTKTFRFASTRIDGLQGASDPPTFPTVTGLSVAPTVLTPGQGLGLRSTCTIQLKDHPYTDVGVDPYLSDRTYDPMTRGSFWSKFIPRWPYYFGRKCRIKTGYLTDAGEYDAANFLTRAYFIETITGPDADGNVSITCKDILRFADAEKAQVPTQSRATLASDITNSATSIAITDPSDDVKDAYDAGQTYIRIDDETMIITGLSGSAGAYTLTVTRAAKPAVYSGAIDAEEHDEGATVQHCHFFSAQEVDDIIYYLLNTAAGIDASFLPTTDWQAVVDFGLQSYTFSALITEPTGVKDLLTELAEHTILMWWDERAQQVKMDSIIQRAIDYGPFDDNDHILADSVNVARDDASRVSQVWVAYGHRTPVAELDELKNFSAVKVSVDIDAEGADQYDQKLVRRIWSRWLHLDKGSVASEIANRLLNYYKETKNIVSIDLDPKDDDAWTGNIVSLATRLVQDKLGSTPTRNYRVIEVNEKFTPSGAQYSYTLQSIGGITGTEPAIYGLIGPNTLGNYGAETSANKNKYAFIAADNRGDGKPGFAPDIEPYIIL